MTRRSGSQASQIIKACCAENGTFQRGEERRGEKIKKKEKRGRGGICREKKKEEHIKEVKKREERSENKRTRRRKEGQRKKRGMDRIEEERRARQEGRSSINIGWIIEKREQNLFLSITQDKRGMRRDKEK